MACRWHTRRRAHTALVEAVQVKAGGFHGIAVMCLRQVWLWAIRASLATRPSGAGTRLRRSGFESPYRLERSLILAWEARHWQACLQGKRKSIRSRSRTAYPRQIDQTPTLKIMVQSYETIDSAEPSLTRQSHIFQEPGLDSTIRVRSTEPQIARGR